MNRRSTFEPRMLSLVKHQGWTLATLPLRIVVGTVAELAKPWPLNVTPGRIPRTRRSTPRRPATSSWAWRARIKSSSMLVHSAGRSRPRIAHPGPRREGEPSHESSRSHDDYALRCGDRCHGRQSRVVGSRPLDARCVVAPPGDVEA